LPATPERPVGLQFDQVEKRYGTVHALRSLTLRVAAGECVAIARRNGSGKTTLLRVATPLVRLGRGTVSYSGGAKEAVPRPVSLDFRRIVCNSKGFSILRSAQDKVVAPAVFDNIISGYPRGDDLETKLAAAAGCSKVWLLVRHSSLTILASARETCGISKHRPAPCVFRRTHSRLRRSIDVRP